MKKSDFGKLAVPEINARILLLTHTDMDGAGPAIILKSVFPNLDVKHCPNAEMSIKIRDAVVLNEKNYDFIFACDISCNEADAIEIDKSPNSKKFVLIDHHATALGLNKYDWAVVEPQMIEDSFRAEKYPIGTGSSSGTGLLFDYVDFFGFTPVIENIKLCKEMVFNISAYDTWDWKKVLDDTQPFILNRIFEVYGIDMFEQSFIERLANPSATLFNETDALLMKIESSKILNFVERKRKDFKTCEVTLKDGVKYNIAYVYAAQYLGEVFEMLEQTYPDVDFYVVHYGTGISLRSLNGKKNDVSKIAAMYGGGGHPEAGAFSFSIDAQRNALIGIFENNN